MPKLSIGICTYNGINYLQDCLPSVFENASSLDFEVIVIDDGSTDGTADFVSRRYPQVRLLVNKRNLGLSASTNRAVREAKGEFYMRLDVDTVIHPNAFRILLQFMDDHPKVGVVGPRLVFPSGRFQLSTFDNWPTPVVVFKEFNFVVTKFTSKITAIASSFSGKQLKFEPRRVAHLIGAAMMLRVQAINEVGLMDSEIAFFRDETDWLYRFHKSGWEIWYQPEAVVTHVGGHSGGSLYIFAKERNLRSFWKFNRKHFPGPWNQLKFWLAVVSGSLISFLLGIFAFIPSLPFRRLRVISLRVMRSFGFILWWSVKGARDLFGSC